MSKGNGKTAILEPVTNGAAEPISASRPYSVEVELIGTSNMLFHRWNAEAVEEKGKAAKGSKAKKTDDIESYIYRCEDGTIGIPGEYLRQAIIHAAKFRQDPRSPRKSAMDLFKAGVVAVTELASLGVTDWDFIDRRRVMVQRNGINRSRPGFRTGWTATFQLLVNLPEYISKEMLIGVINDAGRLVGVADFRPTYGRFAVSRYEILEA